MQFDWWTFALQVVNFLVLVWLLWRFLYRPVREVIEKRKELAERAFAEADERKREADAAQQRFEEDRTRLVQERQELLNKTHEQLEAERKKVLDETAVKAEAMLQDARASLEKERHAALAETRKHVTTLAVELASEIMRNSGSRAPNGFVLDTFERQLREMQEEERERLRKDLEPADANMTVVTAVPMMSEEQTQWTERLSACLGRHMNTKFATDPNLLGGAELHFPHAVLKLSWSDQLQKAEELLQRNESAS